MRYGIKAPAPHPLVVWIDGDPHNSAPGEAGKLRVLELRREDQRTDVGRRRDNLVYNRFKCDRRVPVLTRSRE